MAKKLNQTKLFVIDTNVLLHDPSCLFRFEEHDIYLPMVTIEELDNNKKGSSEVARNARQTHRFLEEIIDESHLSAEWQIKAIRHFVKEKTIRMGKLKNSMPTEIYKKMGIE